MATTLGGRPRDRLPKVLVPAKKTKTRRQWGSSGVSALVLSCSRQVQQAQTVYSEQL
jgi:hypothetical protein